MSGVAIIRSLLAANALVTAAVPTGRIKAGILPMGTALPAIGIMQISGTDRNIVKPRATVRVTERIQVSVLSDDYVTLKTVIGLVRKACRDQRGVIAGYTSVLVLTDGQGPDGLLGDGSGVDIQTQDFMVAFAQTP